MNRSLSLFFFLVMILLGHPSLWALDLGGSSTAGQTPEVKIADQPLKVEENTDGTILEIAGEVQLNNGETYESDYVDVKSYHYATFYALEKNDNSIKVVSTPQAPARYQLDAYFTIDSNTTKLMSMDDNKPKVINKGIQEFGSQLSKAEGDVQPSFEKLSTGETSSRVLYTRIYGPYVRVVLKSLSPKEQQRYRIVAYLTK